MRRSLHQQYPLSTTVAVAVITLAGLWWGGRNSYISLRNRAPVELTCAEFFEHRPDADWLRLTDCDVDLDHLDVEVVTRRNAAPTATTIYIPLRPSAEPLRKAALLLASSQDNLLRLGEIPKEYRRNAAHALTGPIEGILELPSDRRADDREMLQHLHLDLSPDFAVLDYDARPRPLWIALGVLAVGLGGLSLLVFWFRQHRRNRPQGLARAVIKAE